MNRIPRNGMTIRDLMTLAEIAEEITRTRFPCSRRSLARWPLETQIINGRKLASLKQATGIADEMIARAPRIMQDGRRKPPAHPTLRSVS
jgi:hypothetical protein